MHFTPRHAHSRSESAGHPERQAADYVYQAATIAAALLLLLTFAA